MKKMDITEINQQRVDFVTKLGLAKYALMQATKIPEISQIIDNAKAIQAAAKLKHISVPGVNAWTRFVIDAERKGWERIETMRKAGELAPGGRGGARGGGRGNIASAIPTLCDLIERRPTERAAEWSLLSKLTEFQLDELERIANEEDRLLTRTEVLKLAKSSEIPMTSTNESSRNLGVRLSPYEEISLDFIRRAEPDTPGRAEMVRRMIMRLATELRKETSDE